MSVWTEVVTDGVRNKCKSITKSIYFTEDKINIISEKIRPILKKYGKDVSLVLAGSVGRKEAYETSDVDAFFLFEGKVTREKHECESIKDILIERLKTIVDLEEVGLRLASAGAFSDSCFVNDLIQNIGGKNDTNDTLTRRILLLTEGYGIPDGSSFNKVRENILMKYLSDLQSDREKRPIFLINDVVRYYRTICIDYEYKKNEKGKPWAVRLTKLRHSRKLLYFSALLPLLESIKIYSNKKRIDWLKKQFTEYTPLERIILLLNQYGKDNHWDIVVLYDKFLEMISSKKVRDELDAMEDFENRDKNSLYTQLRDNARQFRDVFNDFIFSVDHWQEPLKTYVIS